MAREACDPTLSPVSPMYTQFGTLLPAAHGPIGTVALHFEGIVTKFGNLARDDYPTES